MPKQTAKEAATWARILDTAAAEILNATYWWDWTLKDVARRTGITTMWLHAVVNRERERQILIAIERECKERGLLPP